MSKSTATLEATLRTAKGRNAVAHLRKEGRIPAALYGEGTDALLLSVDARAFREVYLKAGEGQVVVVHVDGTEHPVFVKELAVDPVTQLVLHVDFYRVDLNKEVVAPVELSFEGASPAVKDLAGTLVRVMTEVEVKALPNDMPESIVVDLSALATFDDSISIADLSVPSGVEILADAEETVATVEAPRSEEELAALDEEIENPVLEGEEDQESEGEAAEDESKEAPAESASEE